MAKKIEKKQLGLGVRALLSNMDAEAQQTSTEMVRELTSTVAMVPIGEIEVNPWQPRKDFDLLALDELAGSLKVHGLIQPITVRRMADRQYQVISGERRLRAAKLAGLAEMPAYIRLANDQQMIEMALVENILREDLNALEVAIGYQRLKEECQLSHDALSERVGKQRSTITNYLGLLKLPPDIQKALQAESITMGHARPLVSLEDIDLQLAVFQEVIKHDLSVRATENLAKSYKDPRPAKAAPKPVSGDYQTVETNLRSQLGARVALKVKPNGSGQISIPFSSTKDLNRLLDLMGYV